MPKLVQVPGVGIIQFPDNLKDDFIASEIDRITTGAPGPAKAPMPAGLMPSAGEQWAASRSATLPPPGTKLSEIAPSNFRQSLGQMKSGLLTASRPGVETKAAGASQILRGGMQMAAPALPIAVAAAPVAAGIGLVAGTGAQAVTTGGLRMAGVPQGYADLAGDVVGLAAGTRAAKAVTPESVTALATRTKEAWIGKPLDSTTAMVKAVKPYAKDVNFERNLALSMPELKAVEVQLGKPIQGVDDLIGTPDTPGAVQIAKQKVWAEREKFAGPMRAMNAQVDLTPVADAMEASIPAKLKLENPEGAARLAATADKYRGDFSLAEAEDFLKTGNAELDAYYGKYPGAQRSALASNPDTASLKAQVDATRTAIYKTIDGPGQGAIPRELGRRYGALLDMEQELYRRRNVAARQAPENLTQQLTKVGAAGQIVRAGGRLLTGDVLGAAGDVASAIAEKRIAGFMKHENSTDALIADAFKNWKRQPIRFPAPVQPVPRALLTQGDIITPEPADTSGVRSVPGMYPTGPNPARALGPGGPVVPPPADASYVRSVPGEYAEKVAPQTPAASEIPVAPEQQRSIIESHAPDEASPIEGKSAAVLEPRGPSYPSWNGKAVTVKVPGENRSFEARYAVRELDDVHASHNAFSFEKNPAYQHENERNYSDTRNASRVVSQAKFFDPEFLVTESVDATNGAPIIDGNGNVLGGNSRTMTLDRVYQDHPEHAANYKKWLLRDAAKFGIDPNNIAGMKRPVLVREMTGEVEPRSAITDLNKIGTASLTPEERALSDSHRVSPETLAFLEGKIIAEGQDATLAQTLEGPAGRDILNRLVEDGVLTEQEKGQYTERGALTPEAKRRISRLMVGRMFRDSRQFENAPAELIPKLERISVPLARLKDRPEWDIAKLIPEAIDALQDARAHGLGDPADLIRQQSLSGEASKYNPEAVALASVLKQGPRKVEKAFQQFASDEILSRPGQPATFQEPPTRDEAFQSAFGMPNALNPR